MKAAICTKYGPPGVLRIQDIQKPTPKDNEVLIKMRATTVTSGDVRMRKPDPPILVRLMLGLFKPKDPILGVEIAGDIVDVGEKVTMFKKGDAVLGSTYGACGTYAEYICLAEDAVLDIKPERMSYEDAAALFFGGHTALHFLKKKGHIHAGHDVLIYGASGCLGTYAVQLAKYFGADVTAVCSSKNAELVASLGADTVIDYESNDFTKLGKQFDIIFDTVGRSPFFGSVRSLRDHGYYLRAVHLSLVPLLKGFWTSLTTNKKVVGGVAHEFKEDLVFLKELVIAGKLRPVIDKTFPLEQIADAHAYVETGHKKGNVVIVICDPDDQVMN